MKYEGTLRIRHDSEKNHIVLQRGIQSSTLTPDDPGNILDIMVEAADERKCGIDRWSLYIPEVSEKLPKTAAVVTTAAVKKALKDGNTPFIRAGKWGKPQVVLGKPVTSKRVSKFVDIC